MKSNGIERWAKLTVLMLRLSSIQETPRTANRTIIVDIRARRPPAWRRQHKEKTPDFVSSNIVTQNIPKALSSSARKDAEAIGQVTRPEQPSLVAGASWQREASRFGAQYRAEMKNGWMQIRVAHDPPACFCNSPVCTVLR